MTAAEQETIRDALASGVWHMEVQEHPAAAALRLFHLLLPFCGDRLIRMWAVHFWIVGTWGMWTTAAPVLLVSNEAA